LPLRGQAVAPEIESESVSHHLGSSNGAVDLSYHGAMKIHVNGQDITIDSPCTVEQLLERRRSIPGAGPAPGAGAGARACAVEVNRQLIPKKRHAELTLRDGDNVEIVSLVGGG
jgi:sulfur carrier protein